MYRALAYSWISLQLLMFRGHPIQIPRSGSMLWVSAAIAFTASVWLSHSQGAEHPFWNGFAFLGAVLLELANDPRVKLLRAFPSAAIGIFSVSAIADALQWSVHILGGGGAFTVMIFALQLAAQIRVLSLAMHDTSYAYAALMIVGMIALNIIFLLPAALWF